MAIKNIPLKSLSSGGKEAIKQYFRTDFPIVFKWDDPTQIELLTFFELCITKENGDPEKESLYFESKNVRDSNNNVIIDEPPNGFTYTFQNIDVPVSEATGFSDGSFVNSDGYGKLTCYVRAKLVNGNISDWVKVNDVEFGGNKDWNEKWNEVQSKPVELTDGRIDKAINSSGNLKVELESTSSGIGLSNSISGNLSISRDGSDNLKIGNYSFSGVKVSDTKINDAEINSSGDLIITTSEGSSYNAGRAKGEDFNIDYKVETLVERNALTVTQGETCFVSDTSKLYFAINSGSGSSVWDEGVEFGRGEKGDTGDFFEDRYKRSDTQPETPTGDNPSGWTTYQPVSAENQKLWITRALKNALGQIIVTWSAPVQINGDNGFDGKDGLGVKYIYKTSQTSDTPTTPTSTPPDVPVGWTDDPTGVNIFTRYEFVAQATSDDKGDWSNWTTPILWSKFGADGKGVEYIYKLTNSLDTPPTPASQQQDDYVPPEWTDSPSGVTLNNKYEWICKRTKSNDEWSNFSDPSLFTNYSLDGKDGDSITANFSNDVLEIRNARTGDLISSRYVKGDQGDSITADFNNYILEIRNATTGDLISSKYVKGDEGDSITANFSGDVLEIRNATTGDLISSRYVKGDQGIKGDTFRPSIDQGGNITYEPSQDTSPVVNSFMATKTYAEEQGQYALGEAENYADGIGLDATDYTNQQSQIAITAANTYTNTKSEEAEFNAITKNILDVNRTQFYGVLRNTLDVTLEDYFYGIQFEVVVPCIFNGCHFYLISVNPIGVFKLIKYNDNGNGFEKTIYSEQDETSKVSQSISNLNIKLDTGKYTAFIESKSGNIGKCMFHSSSDIFRNFDNNHYIKLVAGFSSYKDENIDLWYDIPGSVASNSNCICIHMLDISFDKKQLSLGLLDIDEDKERFVNGVSYQWINDQKEMKYKVIKGSKSVNCTPTVAIANQDFTGEQCI